MGYNHHRTPSPDRELPTPPEGYITLDYGPALTELPSAGRYRHETGGRDPIDGVLVYAEGEWKPVVSIDGKYHRTVSLHYAGSKLATAATDGQYGQRVSVDRVAVRPDALPRWAHSRQRDAERVQREQDRREIREEIKREEREKAAAERAARLAAMTPAQRRARIESELVLAELLVESREEDVTAAQARLDEARARVDELRRQLDAQEG